MSIITGRFRRKGAKRLPTEKSQPASAAKEPVVPKAPAYFKESKPKRAKSGKQRWKKWLFWGAIIAIIYFSYNWILQKSLQLLQLNPAVWDIYQGISAEIANRSLLGLFYVTSFGSLFFLPNPFEAAFSYYIAKTQYYAIQLIVIALVGYSIGIAVDYFIGWLIGPKILRFFMRKKYETLHQKVVKAGAWIVLAGNVIPFFPTGPLTLVMGALRYGYGRLALFTIIGAGVKLLLFWLGFTYFETHLADYFSTLDYTEFLSLLGLG